MSDRLKEIFAVRLIIKLGFEDKLMGAHLPKITDMDIKAILAQMKREGYYSPHGFIY